MNCPPRVFASAPRHGRERGLDLLALPTGTRLRLGAEAVVEVSGLRNPCVQLDSFASGLTAAILDRAVDGSVIRKAGVMSVVIVGGEVRAGDAIAVELPDALAPAAAAGLNECEYRAASVSPVLPRSPPDRPANRDRRPADRARFAERDVSALEMTRPKQRRAGRYRAAHES